MFIKQKNVVLKKNTLLILPNLPEHLAASSRELPHQIQSRLPGRLFWHDNMIAVFIKLGLKNEKDWKIKWLSQY